jgi:hypothetical protein
MTDEARRRERLGARTVTESAGSFGSGDASAG